jgi:MOSC domain-containing protein YiiM
MASVVDINISERKGIVKTPVSEARLVVGFGIAGDAHGGSWHRQVSLLGQESIDKMKAQGLPGLSSGQFAENITTEGICLFELPVGTRLQIGPAVVEVTQIGKECHHHCAIYQKVGSCVMPLEGIFAKVLTEGIVRPGDAISILDKT